LEVVVGENLGEDEQVEDQEEDLLAVSYLGVFQG